VRCRHFRVKDVTCPPQAKPDTQAMILVKEDRLSGAVVALPSLDSSEQPQIPTYISDAAW
jgi:hypothetical protein